MAWSLQGAGYAVFGQVVEGLEIVDKIVTQSSDSEFHCLTITLFYKHGAKQ